MAVQLVQSHPKLCVLEPREGGKVSKISGGREGQGEGNNPTKFGIVFLSANTVAK